MDARKASDTTSIALIKICFEGLIRRTQDKGFEYGMAESVKISDDQKTYIFYLKDAKWSDGVSVCAQDFEDSWKTMLDPAFPCPFSNDLYILKNAEAAKKGLCPLDQIGVKSINNKTLEVTLEHPSPYFFDMMAMHSFLPVPSHIVKNNENWADNAGNLFICNGPFKLAQWRHHSQMLMEKNPFYWDKDTVLLNEIDFTVISDEMTELNMFESGQLDWAGYPLSSIHTDASQALKTRLKIFPIAAVYYYVFNVNQPPFNNRNIRRAFTLAMNREEIIKDITQQGQTAATAFIPPIISNTENSYFQDNDIEEAKRLFEIGLKELNLTRETFPTINLSYNTMAAHHRIAQAIAQNWFKTFGIKIELQNMEWKVFLDQLNHKQFQVARMGAVCSYNDPLAFFHYFRYPNSTHNFSGWTNESFTKILNEADVTIDETKRGQLLKEAETIF